MGASAVGQRPDRAHRHEQVEVGVDDLQGAGIEVLGGQAVEEGGGRVDVAVLAHLDVVGAVDVDEEPFRGLGGEAPPVAPALAVTGLLGLNFLALPTPSCERLLACSMHSVRRASLPRKQRSIRWCGRRSIFSTRATPRHSSRILAYGRSS